MPACYSCTVRELLIASTTEVVGQLATKISDAGFRQIETASVESWTEEVEILKAELSKISRLRPAIQEWGVLLEFTIPRRQQRIDAVLLAGELILVLEFKSIGNAENSSSARQVEDYALDLSYFHRPSHNRVIVPVLVGPELQRKTPKGRDSNLRSVATISPEELGLLINSIIDSEPTSANDQIELDAWNHGAYEPVPTIIEAAISLYAGMSVREITHSRAAASDITSTTNLVLQAIINAQKKGEKIVCFITGVPGAGKTLVGMNLAHNPEIHGDGRPASVFMSGNGPLVKILREALARDSATRNRTSITAARKTVATFVQNIHNFVREHLESSKTQLPYEHAIIFDEAQRAWSADQNKRKHRTKSDEWHISEPEMVLKIMDRHEGWAAIVALVGGGQEINEGEAGIAEWGKALRAKYSHWKILASPEALRGGESVAGASLFHGEIPASVVLEEKALHLSTSSRSHQATELATWVNRLLAGDAVGARTLSRTFEQFPIFLSRSLESTKMWLRNGTRGERRCGLIASSGAARLRPEGLEMSLGFRQSYPFDRWFLDESEDIRSSYQLEVAASEFEIQGLELDYVGLCWGSDFIWDRKQNAWRPLKFTGAKWNQISHADRALRVQNRYRVLLTRAREGLVIWLPQGHEDDPTRSVQAMNDTAEYLLRCGAVPIPAGRL